MATQFEEAIEVEKMARELIQKHHSHLVEAKIYYLFREGDWATRERTTLGKAQRVTGQLAFVTGLDFMITINKNVWEHLEDAQKKALVDHELKHCARGEDDSQGNPTWYIDKHDVEDFLGVIRRHGLWMEDLRRLEKAISDYRHQATIFDEDPGKELRPTGTTGQLQ